MYNQNLFGSHTRIQKVSDTSDGSLQSYLLQAQQLSNSNVTATSTVTFLAVGDIMLSRNVAAAALTAKDDEFPFRKMADLLKATDFNFGNLESPFAPSRGCLLGHDAGIAGGNSLIFGASCDMSVGLQDFNLKILNLANNHAMDQGLNGLIFTKNFLSSSGIENEGTGKTLEEAWQPAVIEQNGIKICFVGASYSSENDGGKASNNYVARIEDVARLKAAITTAKSECDFAVVTMHAGTEYTRTPNQSQIDFAHAAIDDGADIVIGAHPHWVQTTEKYKGKYIFYSLGNFVFDQNFSQDTSQGLTLKITISKKQTPNPLAPGAAAADDLQGQRQFANLDSIELLPVIITNSQPRPATDQETKTILKKIGETENILK